LRRLRFSRRFLEPTFLLLLDFAIVVLNSAGDAGDRRKRLPDETDRSSAPPDYSGPAGHVEDSGGRAPARRLQDERKKKQKRA
jgi:hypothetical protein